jgi:hypothetical protein
MKTKSNWKDQLIKAVSNNDNVFGSNTELPVIEIKRYIIKLEKLGAKDITIPDFYSLKFKLPKSSNELLLFILTGGNRQLYPSESVFNSKTNYLTMYFDF